MLTGVGVSSSSSSVSFTCPCVQHLIERIHEQNCEHVLVLMSEILPHRLRLMPQIDACAVLLSLLLLLLLSK